MWHTQLYKISTLKKSDLYSGAKWRRLLKVEQLKEINEYILIIVEAVFTDHWLRPGVYHECFKDVIPDSGHSGRSPSPSPGNCNPFFVLHSPKRQRLSASPWRINNHQLAPHSSLRIQSKAKQGYASSTRDAGSGRCSHSRASFSKHLIINVWKTHWVKLFISLLILVIEVSRKLQPYILRLLAQIPVCCTIENPRQW